MERPLSPHLQIYKPQISSVLSISHRLSGVTLFMLALTVLWGIILKVFADKSIITCIQGLVGKSVFQAGVFLAGQALFYHMFNGFRHLAWDLGYGFELKNMTASGWLVVIASLAANICCWLAFV